MLRHLFLHGKSLIKLALLKFASFSSKIHASERHQADKNKRNLLTGTREKEKDYFRHVASSALRHSSASAMSVDSTPKSKVKHPRVLAALYTLVVTAVIPSGKETYRFDRDYSTLLACVTASSSTSAFRAPGGPLFLVLHHARGTRPHHRDTLRTDAKCSYSRSKIVRSTRR